MDHWLASAMAARAARWDGPVAVVLAERLARRTSQLRALTQDDALARNGQPSSTAPAAAPMDVCDPAPLAQLAAQLRGASEPPGPAAPLRHALPGTLPSIPPLRDRSRRAGSADALPGHGLTLRPLRALEQFPDSWATLRLEQQLADTLARAPQNAGPLNSHRLVARALQQLHTLSPAYLRHFMAHAEALASLEALLDPKAVAASAPAGAGTEKRTSRKMAGRQTG